MYLNLAMIHIHQRSTIALSHFNQIKYKRMHKTYDHLGYARSLFGCRGLFRSFISKMAYLRTQHEENYKACLQISSASINCLDLCTQTFSIFNCCPMRWDPTIKTFIKQKNKLPAITWYFSLFVVLPTTGIGPATFLCFNKYFWGNERLSTVQVVFYITFVLLSVCAMCMGYILVYRWPEICIGAVNSMFSLQKRLQSRK